MHINDTGLSGGDYEIGDDDFDETFDGGDINNGSGVSGGGGDEKPMKTKQRIAYCAAALFAKKGFTETSVRELAGAAGLHGSSIYNHFKSKTAILEYMLVDYQKHNYGAFFDDTMQSILDENPTTEGILSCLQLGFNAEYKEYYINILSMMMQEQHRNPIVTDYVKGIIEVAEQHVGQIIDALKYMGVLRRDADPDYWTKLASCVFYTFSNRMLLGNGDNSPGYKGMGMVALLRALFDNMMRDCGA